MSTSDPEKRFQENVLSLCDLIYDMVTDARAKGYQSINPDTVIFCKGILDKYPSTKLIEGFIRTSESDWDRIHERDDTYFITNADKIFGDLPTTSVTAFKDLFTLKDSNGKPFVESEDREVICEYFETFVKIAISYIHRKRGPAILKRKDGSKHRVYQKLFFNNELCIDVYGQQEWDKTTGRERIRSEINLERHINKWKLADKIKWDVIIDEGKL